MKFSYISTLSLAAATALAAPVQLVPRDTLVIETSIRSIQASLQNLAEIIRSLDSHKPGQEFTSHIRMIQHHGDELATIIHNSAKDVKNGPKVDMIESTKLLMPVQNLATATETAVKAWILQKPTIIKSGGRAAVHTILEHQQMSANEFTDAMVSKLPDLAKYIGQMYGQRIRSTVDQALREFR